MKSNARTRTRKRIEEATIRLLEAKPFSEITVEEIAEAAYLTKTTFYRYFKDKHEVVTFHYHEIMTDVWGKIDSYEALKESMLVKYKRMEDDKSFFRHAYQVEDTNSLFSEERRLLRTTLTNLYETKTHRAPDDEIAFLINLYCIGSMKMIASWVKEGMAFSSETLTKLLLDAMPMRIHNALQ